MLRQIYIIQLSHGPTTLKNIFNRLLLKIYMLTQMY